MNLRRLFFGAVLAISVFIGTLAFAVPSCSVWLKQPDGTWWRTCVGDDGRQYCEWSDGKTVTRVSCNSKK